MKQIELTSKLVLAIVGLTAVGAILVPTYAVPTIRSADIFDETILSADIKNGEVKTNDLADNAVTSAKIADGTITLNVHEVRGEVLTLDPGRTGTAIAFCPDGEILTGGGFETDYGVRVGASAQRGNGDNAWVVEGANDVGSIPLHMEAAAYCLDPTIP